MRVYPNPFNNTFRVDFGKAEGQSHVKIVDVTGKTIMNKKIEGESVEFNLSKYQSGLYNLIVDGNGGIRTCKLIKK